MDRCLHGEREETGVSLAFPAHPTAEDIFRARIFEEPLVPMGAKPIAKENADFAAALVDFADCGGPDDFSALTAFLGAHPRSPWNGALLTNLGLVYYKRGHYSRALQAWGDACTVAMTVTDPAQKPLADRAIGELAYMLDGSQPGQRPDGRRGNRDGDRQRLHQRDRSQLRHGDDHEPHRSQRHPADRAQPGSDHQRHS